MTRSPSEPLVSILMVEDDDRLATLTQEYLEGHGLTVTHVSDAESGLQSLNEVRFDVVLLDLMLPGIDGLEAARRIRERSDVPIIILTAKGEEADRVMGLELGADDYMSKPFSARELLARIRSVVRRMRGEAGPSRTPAQAGRIAVDPVRRHAAVGEQTLDLTSYEFDLLYALTTHPGQVFARERLMELARGSAEDAFDRTVDVHISRLRKKLSNGGVRRDPIRTVRGVGYVWTGEDE